jgi:hypothetical protein
MVEMVMIDSMHKDNHPVLKFVKDQIKCLEDGSIEMSSTLKTGKHMIVSIDKINAYRGNIHFKLSVASH